MFSRLYKVMLSAGDILRQHWSRTPEAMFKKDGSPVTPADVEVGEFLTKELTSYSTFPVVSEEAIPSWEERQNYKTYWLVDPLDGTKEFIGRYGDFSICIALISDKRPVLGIVYAPALDLFYYAAKNLGTYCYVQGKKEKLENKVCQHPIALISRFHNDPKVEEFCQRNHISQTRVAGGALKYCYLADGKGSVYIRYNRMKEWDVAAGDVIVHEAGGKMFTLDAKEKLVYNNADLSLPPFLSVSSSVDSNAFGI